MFPNLFFTRSRTQNPDDFLIERILGSWENPPWTTRCWLEKLALLALRSSCKWQIYI
jgi:hypothetical protein